MRIDRSGGGVEAWIGDPPLADSTVVFGEIFHQVVDGVEGIGAFVDCGFIGGRTVGSVRGIRRRELWTHVDEFTAAHVASANVLEDEDIFLLLECGRGTESGFVCVESVGGDTVGGTANENRVGIGGVWIVGDVDRSEEFDTIAHRDAYLGLAVVSSDKVGSGVRCRVRGLGVNAGGSEG